MMLSIIKSGPQRSNDHYLRMSFDQHEVTKLSRDVPGSIVKAQAHGTIGDGLLIVFDATGNGLRRHPNAPDRLEVTFSARKIGARGESVKARQLTEGHGYRMVTDDGRIAMRLDAQPELALQPLIEAVRTGVHPDDLKRREGWRDPAHGAFNPAHPNALPPKPDVHAVVAKHFPGHKAPDAPPLINGSGHVAGHMTYVPPPAPEPQPDVAAIEATPEQRLADVRDAIGMLNMAMEGMDATIKLRLDGNRVKASRMRLTEEEL